MNNDRRRILLGSGVAVATLGLTQSLALPASPGQRSLGEADVQIELRAAPDRVAVRRGQPTGVLRYHARLLRGHPGSLEVQTQGSLGPTIRVRRGQRVRIELLNELAEPTTIHWHGLHVPDDMDGHPRHAVGPGQRHAYEFTILNRAGTYWYHAHPHGRSGYQVFHGLAGLFLISDDEETALDLPRGPQDLPIVIQDRLFDDRNQLAYPAQDGHAGMDGMTGRGGGGMMGRGTMGGAMAAMMGVLGDELLINGRQLSSMEVQRRPYRLRLVNASNTRTFKLGWSDGSPMTVIGTDGGLLPGPQQRPFVMLAAAERADVWVDFSRWPAGADLALHSLEFEGGMTMGGTNLPEGSRFPVLALRLQGGGDRASTSPPARLSHVPAVQPEIAVNADRPKVFHISMGMMVWGINGRPFEMLQATPEETVKLGTHEIWEFRNEGRGSMMGMVMPHSMHIHGLQFRVLGREVSRRFAAEYATVKAGLVDEGWKDTVLVMPGERVRVLVGFRDYPGLFIYHCHMLEHEDSGLMRNYRVEA